MKVQLKNSCVLYTQLRNFTTSFKPISLPVVSRTAMAAALGRRYRSKDEVRGALLAGTAICSKNTGSLNANPCASYEKGKLGFPQSDSKFWVSLGCVLYRNKSGKCSSDFNKLQVVLRISLHAAIGQRISILRFGVMQRTRRNITISV